MPAKSFNARHGITVGVNQVPVADANGNITANTILVGGVSINSTTFPGTANNATYFAGQPSSYYTNATNLSSGTIDVLRLPTSGVTAGAYGNSTQVPIVTVDTYGRVTSLSTATITASGGAGINTFSYSSSNSTLVLQTTDSSIYTATITAANSTVAGVITVIDSTTNTSIDIAASANTVKNAYDRAIDANTRASSAQTAAVSAYSNAVSFATDAAANAYSNAVIVAGTAYTNAVSVASADATSKANNAYTTAVSAAASDATDKAANAYSNAVSYASSIAGTAYSNAASYADTKAAAAYSNATSYADTKADTAYSNAVSTAATDATSKAGVAYVNATSFAANASNINSGTLAEARLPYRMNQNVRTTDSVTFANGSFTGAVDISGTTTLNANVTLGSATRLILSSTSGISANGSYGSSGQMLTSNGSAVYWSTPTGGGGGGTSVTTEIVTTTNVSAQKDYRYILTNTSNTTVTLPASPTLGDTLYVTVANDLLTNIVARNGSNIMGAAEDLTLNVSDISVGLVFSNTTLGWRVI